MQLDKYHKQILRTIGHYGESTYSKLFEAMNKSGKINKATFQKKLYELITEGKLVERNPPSAAPIAHTGKEVVFRLTASKKTTVDVQEICSEIENKYSDKLEEMIDRSLQLGKSKPLTGATLHITSVNTPIYTIVHLPSKEQAEQLKQKIKNEAIREELSMQINHLIQGYLDIDEHISKGQYRAFYLSAQEVVFYMGFLPNQQAMKVQELVNKGLFENYKTATQSMLAITFFRMLDSIYDKFKTSPEFREGREGVKLTLDYYYNPKAKIIQPIPQNTITH